VQIPEPDTLFDDYAGRGKAEHTQDMTIAKTMNDVDLKFSFPKNLTPEQEKAWHDAYDAENAAMKRANLQGRDLVRWKYQRYIKDYLRCIDSVDENVGRVLDYLDKEKLSENTIVIYSADQGFYLGEHGWFDKRWFYEQSVKTPLMVRWPGVVKPGSVNEAMVANLDFGETLLEAAGAKVPADMQGRSFVPLLKGEAPKDWRTSFYYHYYEFPGPHSVRRHYGVVERRYKLMHFYEADVNEWEMFDLEADPKELKSVYKDPKYAKERERLEKELARLRNELKVPKEDTYKPPTVGGRNKAGGKNPDGSPSQSADPGKGNAAKPNAKQDGKKNAK
jgi:arylsulfatase A-like enzyme